MNLNAPTRVVKKDILEPADTFLNKITVSLETIAIFDMGILFWKKIKSLEVTLAEKESKIELLVTEIQELKKNQIEVNYIEENDCQGNDEEINVMDDINDDDFIESREDFDTEYVLLTCDQCNFEAKSASGLKIHTKRIIKLLRICRK